MKVVAYTVIASLSVFIASAALSVFFQSPPTRAEFNTFKGKVEVNQSYIKESLTELKQGQKYIIKRFIEER